MFKLSDTRKQLRDAARKLAQECDVPVVPGTPDPVDGAAAAAFFADLPAGAAMIVKAVAGGGGRGMRVVRSAEEAETAVAAARREAEAAFGNGDVYV